MRECHIKHEETGGVDILRLDGALDAYSFPRLEHAFEQLRARSRNQIVLDCSSLDYINSASLGALISVARRVREQGGDLKLAALTPKIFSIVELLGFDKMLQIYPDPQLAVSKFAQG